MERKQLIGRAIQARENAYCPYSGFAVGAALLAKDGSVTTGCNIENASFTPTCCAERVAFFQAVSHGVRDFSGIVVVGGQKGGELRRTVPCGVCLQVMAEFCVPEEFDIIAATSEEDYEVMTLKELLPCGFALEEGDNE